MLSGFPEVKIGQKYTLDGKEVEGMPASLAEYSSIVVEYEVMKGWTEDVSTVKRFEDLPANCQAYVLRLEELIGVPIRYAAVIAIIITIIIIVKIVIVIIIASSTYIYS